MSKIMEALRILYSKIVEVYINQHWRQQMLIGFKLVNAKCKYNNVKSNLDFARQDWKVIGNGNWQ